MKTAALLILLAGLAGLWIIWRARARRNDAVDAASRRAPRRGDSRSAARVRHASAVRAADRDLPGYTVASASEGILVEEVHSGFYDDVASMLESQLAAHPARTDLHMTLLDMHHAAGRSEAFLLSARQFAPRANADQWIRVVELGSQLGIDLAQLRAPVQQVAQPSIRLRDGPVNAAEFEVESPAVPTDVCAPADTAGAGRGAALRHYDRAGLDGAELDRRLDELRAAYAALRRDPAFVTAYADIVSRHLERPTPLVAARRLSEHVGGAGIYVKREDLAPADSERLLNALGQALIGHSMGRRRLICGSCEGGSARAYAVAARALNMPATLFVPCDADISALEGYAQIEFVRIAPQAEGVDRDPRRAALACWLDGDRDAHYVTGLKAGPDPYPSIVSDFQATCGHEVLRQLMPLAGALPTAVVGSVEAGFASIGLCQPFLQRRDVTLNLVERATRRDPAREAPALPLREHAWLAATGRVQFVDVTRADADTAARLCSELEGLQLAPGSARAVARAADIAQYGARESAVVVLVGR